MWTLGFDGGTLTVDGADLAALPGGFAFDPRVGLCRGPAYLYGPVVEAARAGGVELVDEARRYQKLELRHLSGRTPRPYQDAAVAAWREARWRGIVVLPTGAGKSFVAERCISVAQRSTLVVVPTLDLLSQWMGNLRAAFGVEVGALGGGVHDIRDLTVATYDSAWMHVDKYGHRFGLVVFDEVHHLPAPAYMRAAEGLIAPLRLGLTATLERPDGRHQDLFPVVGPEVHRVEIPELAGDFLAPYDTEVIRVALSPGEQEEYARLRGIYKEFVAIRRINMRGPQGWQRFIIEASRSKEGRQAFKAFLAARRIAHGTERKIDVVRALLAEHAGRRAIVFTNDNDTAMRISRELLVPCITHHTDVKERRWILDAFVEGKIHCITTSRVLNEGVDLPAAEVAIVVSGTSTVREAVQRLGRILRPSAGKTATLYELVAEGTTEAQASERRREHDAYR
ncbi:MAG: DEAD/DEAH box helicase family protein [Deltaproteobacteria bacterium]|nr:DEAD/DEAH box helicase family protein [Deltaproteobacteria bacterium]